MTVWDTLMSHFAVARVASLLPAIERVTHVRLLCRTLVALVERARLSVLCSRLRLLLHADTLAALAHLIATSNLLLIALRVALVLR